MRHHWLSVLFVIATAPLAGPATPLAPPWDVMRVKHAWDAVPANWERLGPPPPGTTIDLHVALKPHEEKALIDALYEVSSPGHPKYGAHLSKEEVAKLVAPRLDTLKLVHSWLEHHAIPSSSISTTHGGGWLTLTGVSVSQANEMFNASYQLYQHAGTNDSTILRTVSYSLPTVLHTHVQTVAPTTYFASMRVLQQTSRRSSVGEAAALAKVGSTQGEPVTVMSSRDDSVDPVTPEFLRDMYGTIEYEPAATGQNALGIVGYLDNNPSRTDLTTFMSVFRTDAVFATYAVEQVNGGEHHPGHPDVSENLVMQYAQAIAYPTPLVHYSAGGGVRWTLPSDEPAPDDLMLAWLNYVLGKDKIPQTISSSYGHDEKKVPLEYTKALCDLFAQFGARGVSILFASGNGGVGAGDCEVNDGSGASVHFKPLFPASCPWVTSVGGTTNQYPEVAAILSGGGFSDRFTRPAYQDDVVPTFLEHLGEDEYKGYYNPEGRGIPDIASQALNFDSVTGPNVHTVNGTACATATVAGIISLLNDFLISNRKPPLGFLNPWLYGEGLDGIKDIIYGSNPGCGTNGFTAIAGWDPITGLGTPDFIELQDVLFYGERGIMPTPTPTPTPRL